VSRLTASLVVLTLIALTMTVHSAWRVDDAVRRAALAEQRTTVLTIRYQQIDSRLRDLEGKR
jgi:hypothetical protein